MQGVVFRRRLVAVAVSAAIAAALAGSAGRSKAMDDDRNVLPRESPEGLLFGGFKTFRVPLPQSADNWRKTQPQLRAKLWKLLGDVPPPFTPRVETIERRRHPGFEEQRIRFANGLGDSVYGCLLIPDGVGGGSGERRPAVLYHHYHGGKYEQGIEELFRPAFAEFGNETLVTGPALVREGYVVLAIDAYGFGERHQRGPTGNRDRGQAVEAALFKTFAWQGRTLWGMIVHDDLSALNYLLSRDDVDPARVAAMGMSMGATRSWWAAALDDRIRCTVSVACLTRYQDLLAAGSVNFHGIYYFVPGVLKEQIDTEAICGLIAPRAHLTLSGALDAGSPLSGVKTVNDFQERLYGLFDRPKHYRGIVYVDVGHAYTPEMWRETIDFLRIHLRGVQP